MRSSVLPWCLCLLVVLSSQPLRAADAGPQAVFWENVQRLRGQSFQGRVVEGTAPGDAAFKEQVLTMHVLPGGPDEIRIPFHVGADRSRTWVLTRVDGGLRLKHDHRHADGNEDKVSRYGGDTATAGTAERQDFPADAFTAELLPAAKTNIWTFTLLPGRTFGYGLRREAEARRFRVEFDLTKPLPPVANAAPASPPAQK